MNGRYALAGLVDTTKAVAESVWRIVKGVWCNADRESAQQERQMSRGNREKKKPKADKSKAKPAVAVTPFGAASNAGKPAGKRK